VNVKGPLHRAKAAPLLARGASVIFNGSINGLIGCPGRACTRP
jgi:hypothetical protein